MTITEFLLARIGEDEATARAAEHADGPRTLSWSVMGRRRLTFNNGRHEDYVAVACGDWDRILVARDGAGDRPEAVSTHIARHDPARVLDECEAKRRIVELHSVEGYDTVRGDEYVCGGCVADSWPSPHPADVLCPTLAALASIYADHPDFREEWRVD